MNAFKKLLDTAQHANLISEEDATVMLNDYNASQEAALAKAAEDAAGSAFKEGYDQGFTNAKQQAEIETKKKLDELLTKCDEEATLKLQTIIEMFNQNSEEADADAANKLEEVYNILTSQMVPISAMEEMDADHAQKFAEALQAKDEYCANKLAIACEKVREKDRKILKNVKNRLQKEIENTHIFYEEKLTNLKNILTEERKNKIELLSESVEKYLNYSLQQAIPTKKLISEAKYNASQKAIDKIISILKINNILQESNDDFIRDYTNKMNSAKEDINKLMIENSNLKTQLNKQEAQLVLESKIAKCTPAEAAFLKSYFKNAINASVIEEEINDAQAAFKRLQSEKRSHLVEKTKSNVKPSAVVNESKTVNEKESVNTKKQVVTESSKETSIPKTFAEVYAEMLTK
jgi:hypothetical protein